jgi:lysozyme family protein
MVFMKQNYGLILQEIFGSEGGFTLDPKDKGNWTGGKVGVGELKGTKYGISAAAYPKLDIRNLTLQQAGEIYRAEYWNAVGGDSLPSGVDYTVMDAAVNSGTSRARDWYALTRKPSPDDTIDAYNDKRISFLRGLSSFSTYGRGWLNRVAKVRAKSLAMYWTAVGYSNEKIAEMLTQRAGVSQKDAKDYSRIATGTGTVGTISTGTSGTHDVVIAVIVFVIFAAALAFLIHKQRAKSGEADAFSELAHKITGAIHG